MLKPSLSRRVQPTALLKHVDSAPDFFRHAILMHVVLLPIHELPCEFDDSVGECLDLGIQLLGIRVGAKLMPATFPTS